MLPSPSTNRTWSRWKGPCSWRGNHWHTGNSSWAPVRLSHLQHREATQPHEQVLCIHKFHQLKSWAGLGYFYRRQHNSLTAVTNKLSLTPSLNFFKRSFQRKHLAWSVRDFPNFSNTYWIAPQIFLDLTPLIFTLLEDTYISQRNSVLPGLANSLQFALFFFPNVWVTHARSRWTKII